MRIIGYKFIESRTDLKIISKILFRILALKSVNSYLQI